MKAPGPTAQPASILRVLKEEDRHRQMAAFIPDLKAARSYIGIIGSGTGKCALRSRCKWIIHVGRCYAFTLPYAADGESGSSVIPFQIPRCSPSTTFSVSRSAEKLLK